MQRKLEEEKGTDFYNNKCFCNSRRKLHNEKEGGRERRVGEERVQGSVPGNLETCTRSFLPPCSAIAIDPGLETHLTIRCKPVWWAIRRAEKQVAAGREGGRLDCHAARNILRLYKCCVACCAATFCK
jgi:hypothetical protein